MDNNTLEQLAIIVGTDLLLEELKINKKHPVDQWCYEIDPEDISEEEDAKLVTDNMKQFHYLLNNAVEKKLKYLYSEGFTRKENGYYYTLSKKEIEDSVNNIYNTIN